MVIVKCDICGASVNNFGHWYNGKKTMNMYILKCVYDSNNTNSFDEINICHSCVQKLFNKNESEV